MTLLINVNAMLDCFFESACAAALTVGEVNAYAYSDNSFADIENILTFFAL